jgi:hypothetical protein
MHGQGNEVTACNLLYRTQATPYRDVLVNIGPLTQLPVTIEPPEKTAPLEVRAIEYSKPAVIDAALFNTSICAGRYLSEVVLSPNCP